VPDPIDVIDALFGRVTVSDVWSIFRETAVASDCLSNM
jgi:hypothetical protein